MAPVQAVGRRSQASERLIRTFSDLDVPRRSTSEVYKAIRRIPRLRQKQLIKDCAAALADKNLRRDEQIRVSASKVLVASIPDSLAPISRLLAKRDGVDAHETHFSLFVFLADVEECVHDEQLTQAVIDMMRTYLMNVRTGAADAAWMAAHALGDHLRNARAMQVLREVATAGRYSAGRSAAVAGLGEWIRDQKSIDRAGYLAIMSRVSRTDRSPSVRASARLALRGM